jgi:transcriptional regulator with XRE-family HTH domain
MSPRTTEEPEVRLKWGTAIREQRTFKKMTQVQLAAAVGVDQTAVSAWERGAKAPSLDNQVAIARALGVNARVLFTYPEAA